MHLSREAFDRGARFVREHARPLERARFAHVFEGASAEGVLDALARFANPDGGFGNAFEPDFRLPASSALATSQALRLLRELGQSADQPLVQGGLTWLESHFEKDIAAWRAVPAEVAEHPHADHWSWELHAPGGTWPHGIIPRAEALSHFYHWRGGEPRELVVLATDALIRDLPSAEPGGDSVVCLDVLARTRELPAPLAAALHEHVPRLALAIVSRDPAEWSDYCAKPLKLAPSPESTLASLFLDDVARNIEYEIEAQQSDGSWAPNWTWRGAYPEHWEVARREWQGVRTLETLTSLRDYDCIDGFERKTASEARSEP